MTEWQPIETAPKDGRAILLLSEAYTDKDPITGTLHQPARAAIGYWNPEGTSWVDEYGRLDGDCYELAVTGNWISAPGWFQPNEVTHWAPLPEPPALALGIHLGPQALQVECVPGSGEAVRVEVKRV